MDPAGILTPAAKVKVAQELCAEFGVLPQDCVAYGDSLSDTELFAAVPVSVAVNADHHVRAVASHAYTGESARGLSTRLCYKVIHSPWAPHWNHGIPVEPRTGVVK